MLAIFSGMMEITFLESAGEIIADIFTKIFKTLSVPIISLSIISTLAKQESSWTSKIMWQRVVFYTLTTTLIAASLSAVLYYIISPTNIINTVNDSNLIINQGQTSYFNHLSNIIPSNILVPFIEQNVLSILLISLVIGAAIQTVPNGKNKSTIISFFSGIYSVFLNITKWVLALMPIALFGFLTTSILQMKQGGNINGIIDFLLVVLLANVVQGAIILPIWLQSRGINAYDAMRKMAPALSLAFFSKSSAGVVPVTINNLEQRMGVNPQVSSFVVPLCTSINMNGCAAFIFTTVIFVMQNYGVEINFFTMITWILIATIAAIGNAGVPMGCFFLSISLLSSMNIPVAIMGIILPFYNLIDMVETALNVWSDSCVTLAIDQDIKARA
jgi:Na+/H+-dicarboxylate symporter